MRIQFYKTKEGYLRSVFIDNTCCVNINTPSGWSMCSLNPIKDCTKKCCFKKWESQEIEFERAAVNIPTRFMFLIDEKQDN